MGNIRTAFLVLALAPSLAFAKDRVRDTTICEINSHERENSGKMVRVRGRVVLGFEWFFIEEEQCGLALAYPEGPAELGPIAMYQPNPEPHIPANFQVVRDHEYEKFIAYAEEGLPQKPKCGVCFDCHRYEVTVTLTGLFQVAKKGKPGFGHMNEAMSRLVIRSVSDVEPVDISNKYQDWSCGPPELTLPTNPYPGWNEPISVPPYPSVGAGNR